MNKEQLSDITKMIKSMSKLDFSQRLKIKEENSDLSEVVSGLNMLNDKLGEYVINNTFLKLQNNELSLANKEASDYKYALDQSAIVAITNTKGDIEYVNDMFCNISKFSMKELIGQNQKIVNSGHHTKEFWKQMWATIGKGRVWRSEIKNKAKDGSYYWVDTTIVPFLNGNLKPSRYLAIRHDITNRMQRELELEGALKEISDHKHALDQSAIVVITDTKGDIEYVNDMFCKISKFSMNELIGKNQKIVNSGYHPTEFWKQMWATIGKGQVWRSEIKNKAKDGSYYWVDTTIVPFINKNGKPERYLAIRHDITEKKQKELELERYREELEQVNESLEKFTFTAAHDIKTPLNSASGLISLIEMELMENENKNIALYFSLLKDTFDSSGQLINGILEYSKTSISRMKMENLDLGVLFSRAANNYYAKQNVVINIDQTMPVVKHYKTALTQIIDNLLSNAVKYNDKEVCEIVVKCIEKSDCYEISIADNGPGIAEAHRDKVFELFENLKTMRKDSTGIGLATTKKLITEANGRIWIEQAATKGANFVFTINR